MGSARGVRALEKVSRFVVQASRRIDTGMLLELRDRRGGLLVDGAAGPGGVSERVQPRLDASGLRDRRHVCEGELVDLVAAVAGYGEGRRFAAPRHHALEDSIRPDGALVDVSLD